MHSPPRSKENAMVCVSFIHKNMVEFSKLTVTDVWLSWHVVAERRATPRNRNRGFQTWWPRLACYRSLIQCSKQEGLVDAGGANFARSLLLDNTFLFLSLLVWTTAVWPQHWSVSSLPIFAVFFSSLEGRGDGCALVKNIKKWKQCSVGC